MATSRRTVPTFVYICGIPKTFSVKQDANSGISIELHMAMETSLLSNMQRQLISYKTH